jgi:hypothetical protein
MVSTPSTPKRWPVPWIMPFRLRSVCS